MQNIKADEQKKILINKCKDLSEKLKALRCAPSPLFKIKSLISETCVCCGNEDLSVCRYPAFCSNYFSGLLLLVCEKCGISAVPSSIANLNLEEYYRNHYASEFRVERFCANNFYSPSNPVWEFPKHAVRDRAREICDYVENFGPFKNVLDIGAGEGFFLHLIRAENKFADELDVASRKILTNELGVKIVSVEDDKDKYDLILASHYLEHLTDHTIHSKLEAILSALTQGGFFFCEVPPGASQIQNFNKGWRKFLERLEPHTLFFSSYSLVKIMTDVGFEILDVGVCPWTKENKFQALVELCDVKVDFKSGPLRILARKK